MVTLRRLWLQSQAWLRFQDCGYNLIAWLRFNDCGYNLMRGYAFRIVVTISWRGYACKWLDTISNRCAHLEVVTSADWLCIKGEGFLTDARPGHAPRVCPGLPARTLRAPSGDRNGRSSLPGGNLQKRRRRPHRFVDAGRQFFMEDGE